ncbi:MAG: hypothetical protein AAB804_00010 [Patescibacteria group bacterium]
MFRDTLSAMWSNLLVLNAILWALSGMYLIYSIGTAILKGQGKQLLLALLLFVFLSVVEIALGAIAEP